MSYCATLPECNYNCPAKAKCRKYTNRDNFALERPVKDTQKDDDNEFDTVTYCGKFPPPEPPQHGEWDLQFCKWWGWTWVKKGDGGSRGIAVHCQASPKAEIIPDETYTKKRDSQFAPVDKSPDKKKKKKFLCCFKRNAKEEERQKITERKCAPQQDSRQKQKKCSFSSDENLYAKESTTSFDECCCCCNHVQADACCCCPCSQVCPCMMQTQMCCPCNNIPSKPSKKRRDSKTIETQTRQEVKEQCTKMSVQNIPKDKGQNTSSHRCCKQPHRRCICIRKTCCPCMRPVCCPCIQNNSCNCAPNNSPQSNNRFTSMNDQILNLCLTTTQIPNLKETYKLNKTDLPFLQKPLDLLLKNNKNIMKLFGDDVKAKEEKLPNFLDTTDTISFLSANDSAKRKDQEHCKLLTAVCDAILSSHKFDDDKQHLLAENLLSATTSKSTQKSHCESRDSLDKGLLEKILNETNYFNRKRSSNDEVCLQTDGHINSEIGIQVNENPAKPANSSSRNRQHWDRPVLSMIPTSRGYKRTLPKSNVCTDGTKICDSKKLKTGEESRFDVNNYQQNIHAKTSPIKSMNGGAISKQTKPKLEDIEKLLTCVDLNVNSDFNQYSTRPKRGDTSIESIFQFSKGNVGLLDATSPPFTDTEELMKDIHNEDANKAWPS